MKNMQRNLMLIIVLGIVTTTFISGFTSLISFSSIGKDRSNDILRGELALCATYLDAKCYNVEKKVESLSEDYRKKMPKIDELNTEIGDAYIEETKELAKTVVSYNDSICAIYYRLNPELTHTKSGFFLSRTDSTKEVIDSEPTDLALYDETDVEHVGWFYEPKNARKAIWVVQYMNKNNGILTLSFVNPIYTSNGQFIGVVGIDMDMKEIQKEVKGIQLYQTGYAALMSENGNIQFSPHQISLSEKDKQKIINGKSGQVYSYIEGQKRMTVLANKLRYGDYLIISIPDEDLYMNENRMGFSIILITISVSLLIILLLTGLLYRIFYVFKTDTLTHAENRNSYMEVIMGLNEDIRSKKLSCLDVIVFDINGLKKVNDEVGHAAGDKLITDAADILYEFFPGYHIYRIGGDEFVIISKESHKYSLTYTMEKFNDEMQERIKHMDEENHEVIMSVGMASYDENTDICYEDVFNRADQQMYANKVEFYKNNATYDRRK